jgi:mannose-6-phosphate isomerase
LDLVKRRDVQTGDSLFIRPGTIHALGPGLLIYEVQQTSDITYRVYDWDRPKTGRRKLHIEQAIEVLDPDARGEVKSGSPDTTRTRREKVVECNYFSLELIAGQEGILPFETHGRSFSAITVLEGKVFVWGQGWEDELGKFEPYLIPASCDQFSIELQEDVRALHAFVP